MVTNMQSPGLFLAYLHLLIRGSLRFGRSLLDLFSSSLTKFNAGFNFVGNVLGVGGQSFLELFF
jgi:hypothetical protein